MPSRIRGTVGAPIVVRVYTEIYKIALKGQKIIYIYISLTLSVILYCLENIVINNTLL